MSFLSRQFSTRVIALIPVAIAIKFHKKLGKSPELTMARVARSAITKHLRRVVVRSIRGEHSN